MDLPNVDTLTPSKTALVRRVDATSRESFQRSKLLIADKPGTWKKKVSWDEFGCISEFDIPEGWYASVPGGGKIISSYISPRMKKHCRIDISFYRYGMIVGNAKEVSQRKKLLKAPPHKLTNKEMTNLSRLLSGFKKSVTHKERELISCKTQDLNGKRVIVVESIKGPTEYAPKKKRVSFLVDPTDEGTECLIIEYSADATIFDKQKEKALNAINSVKWKDFKRKKNDNQANSPRELLDFPLVKTFKIPRGWNAAPKGLWVPGTTTRYLHPKENEEVTLSLTLVDHAVGHSTSRERRFRRKLVKQKPHKLTEKEIAQLPEYLSMYSSKAKSKKKFVQCKTIKLRDKPAIFVEVDYLIDDTVIRKVTSMFIDPTGQGMDYIKLAFKADPKNHKKYYRKALRSMKSIRLKKDIKKKADSE